MREILKPPANEADRAIFKLPANRHNTPKPQDEILAIVHPGIRENEKGPIQLPETGDHINESGYGRGNRIYRPSSLQDTGQ